MLRIGTKRMTPQDDRLAALLVDMGFSFRRIASLMEITDKTAKAAAERGLALGDSPAFPARTKRKARELLDFFRWLAEGDGKGYLEPLASYLERGALPESEEVN